MIYYLQKIILCISALAVLGASIQYILTKIDDIRYPAPGEMVDIGGYRLHIQTMGVGDGPTIVLDMGIGGNLLYWSLVQSEVAKFAKVVSYDRAGIGWSDTSPLPRTGENIVKELRSLLHNAKIPGPYILVGHSFAGVNARLYANKYPDEVAGIVLVDSSHEDQLEDLPKPTDFLSNLLDAPRIYPLVIALTRVGLVRLFNLYNGESDMFDQETRSIMVAKNSSTKFIKAFLVEWGLFSKI